MKIFEKTVNTEWVYSTQDLDLDAVSFAQVLKEMGWDNSSVATEMANRFIYMSLLGEDRYDAPKIGDYDFNDASIDWDEDVIKFIRDAFSDFVWQYFVDDEDDYDPKELDYQKEINGITVHININESYDHSITLSI